VGLGHAQVGVELARVGHPLEFSAAHQAKVKEILARYPADRPASAVLPVLWLAQEQFGFISEEAVQLVARSIGITDSEVSAVATFYTMFHLAPVGRHLIQFCCTLTCSLMGAETLVRHIEKRLGIAVGETTADGRYTLKKVECLAACGGAPMMQVNETYYENLDEAAVDRILDGLR
jgi:NADH-quinone oxidoreductase subunit E